MKTEHQPQTEQPKPNPAMMNAAELGEYLESLKISRRTARDTQDRERSEARAKENDANNEIDKALRGLQKLRVAEENAMIRTMETE